MSEWEALIVPASKTDGSIWICGDYKITISPVTKSNTYPFPGVEDLFANLAGGCLFTKIGSGTGLPTSTVGGIIKAVCHN